jgi:hypothetical protein
MSAASDAIELSGFERRFSVLQRSKPTTNGLAANLRQVSRLIRTGCPGLCAEVCASRLLSGRPYFLWPTSPCERSRRILS